MDLNFNYVIDNICKQAIRSIFKYSVLLSYDGLTIVDRNWRMQVETAASPKYLSEYSLLSAYYYQTAQAILIWIYEVQLIFAVYFSVK